AHAPELVVVDIRMPPGQSTEGLDAARSIREEFPEIAIVLLSAHVEVDTAVDLLQGGERLGYLLQSRVLDAGDLVAGVGGGAREKCSPQWRKAGRTAASPIGCGSRRAPSRSTCAAS